MEETNGSVERSALARRLFVKTASMAFIAAVIALGAGTIMTVVGAVAGVVLGAAYAFAFIRSHAARTSNRVFDPTVARSAGVRLALSVAVGASMWILGRDSFLGFIVAFSVSFAVFAVTELPRVVRGARSRPTAG